MKQREPDDPDHTWARDVVEHQLTQLKQLVDDLLEVSRVTGGKVRLDREPVDVATIVAYAVETSRPTIEAHRHRLSIALPPEPVIVEADPNRMAQVLVNLLNNAAKYTEDGGQIRLAVAREGDRVAFRVRDTRRRHPPRDARPHLRPLRASGSVARPFAGGPGSGPDPGAQPRRAARRDGRGAQRRAGSRQRVHRPAARA